MSGEIVLRSSIEGTLTGLASVTVTQLAFESIRTGILNRTLAPGSRIVETTLANQLNVSKTPVREALIVLREIGLIEPDGRRGDRVIRRSAKTLSDAYGIREGLEVLAVRCAAERSSPAQRDIIRTAAARSLAGARAGDVSEFVDCDMKFHRAIVETADNPRLATIVENAFTLIVTLRERDMREREVSIRCGEEHVAISAAIDLSDAAAAETLLREHISYVRERVIATVLAADSVGPDESYPNAVGG